MIPFILFVIFQVVLAYFGRLESFWLGIDQLLNVVIGSGYCDETLSAFAHRRGGWRRSVINTIFFWQPDHCSMAYQSELMRKQLPSEYRA